MKTILSIAAVVFTVLNLPAQGTVSFGSVGTGTGATNPLTMMPISGTAFRASLYYLPFVEGAPLPQTQDFVIALRPDTTSFLASGQFAAGTRSTQATTMPGGIAWFQVKLWEVAFGTSYEQALSSPLQGGRCAVVGTSNIVKVQTGNGSTIAPGSLIASGSPGFGGLRAPIMAGAPCPEPATVGLSFLGLAVCALIKFKKK